MRLSHSYSSLKLYENCPKRYLHQRVLKEVQDEGGEASKYGERIHEALELRLKEDKTLPQESARYEPLCQSILKASEGGVLEVEQELTLTENLTPTGWWDADAWLRSKLDILIIKGDTAIVMDWKTGKRRPDFTQLELFALQVFKHFPEVKAVKSTFIWLKDMSMDTETYSREDSNAMWASLMERINRIYESLEHDNWPPKPSGLCRYCPARHMCEYAAI